MPDYCTRPLPTIAAALTAAAHRRTVLTEARDRRNDDMLRALRDVEDYEQRIHRVDQQFDALFDERDLALRAQTAGPA